MLEEYVIVKMSKEDFLALPEYAIKGSKTGTFGVEALVLKSEVSSAFRTEHTTLEDIILFLARGEK